MYEGKKIIITICARGGSKGVPGKNIKLLFGKPLIEYTIDQAKSVPWIDRIIVSTEDVKIKKIAEKNNIEVPFLRPKALAGDKAAKIPAIIYAVQESESIFDANYDIVCDLDPTSPLRNIEDIKNVIKILSGKPKTKSVFSVCSAYKNPYFNMVEKNKDGFAEISKKLERPIVRRQDAPKVYEMNASIYAIWKNVLLKEKTFFTSQTRVYEMPRERSVDIDSPVDFKLVEILMKSRR